MSKQYQILFALGHISFSLPLALESNNPVRIFKDHNIISPYVLLIMHASKRGSLSRSVTYRSMFIFCKLNVTHFDITTSSNDVLFEVLRTWGSQRNTLFFLQYHDALLSHLDSRIAMCTRKYYSKVLEDHFPTILLYLLFLKQPLLTIVVFNRQMHFMHFDT